MKSFRTKPTDNAGEQRERLKLGKCKLKVVPELPDTFTNIRPAHFTKKNPCPPKHQGMTLPVAGLPTLQLALEYEWLEKVRVTEEVDGTASITWSSHHASQKRGLAFDVSISSLLPLLRDEAHSVSTIRHVMDKIRDVVTLLNPQQVPVIAADQPLYALAKQIQWHWPERYGEDKFLIMFGGLHIEMAALKSAGTLLRNSGWTGVLVEADVTTTGTAESFLSASSITRTRQMHQITACSLHSLLMSAYNEYVLDEVDHSEDILSFEEWCKKRKQQSKQFQFWNLVLSMELVIMSLIRAFREANFSLYCQALSELMPFFFANNNVNYARWLTIHIRDMSTLHEKHPQLAAEFHRGNFVVHKSGREFSAIAIDQAHEQANAVIKGDGGAVGLTEDPSALRRWMVAGPEVSQLIARYETASEAKDAAILGKHHEQTERAQRVFSCKVKKLSRVMKDMGNPFQEEGDDLVTLDTKDIAHPSAGALIRSHYQSGKSQFDAFIRDLEHGEESVYKPIKRTKTDFFKQEERNQVQPKQKALKEDCRLFSRLFISCQTRECDLNVFFRHENQAFPAALSDGGKLHTCQKSQLSTLLEACVTIPECEPDADTIIIDGSALVNALPPRTSTTFADYVQREVMPTIEAYSTKYIRTDIVFDVYQNLSLKTETRETRGSGTRRRVSPTGKIPPNWRSFLRNNTNKTELFNFLADQISDMQSDNAIIATREGTVVSNRATRPSLTPCDHEEADTRLFVHVRDAVREGRHTIIVKASDTDVLVIALAILPELIEVGLERMWLAYGQGMLMRYIPIHELALSIGPEKSSGILFFHAFTGCDVVSAFRGKGKKTAWQTWNVCAEASDVFSKLSQNPPSVEESDMKILEKFVVLMYDRSSSSDDVDEARLDLFTRKQRPYESIPPTKAALIQHAKRAAYQAGIWRKCTDTNIDPPDPADWGWARPGDRWEVIWSDLEPIAKSCRQLTKCGCKTECCGRCKCKQLALSCTALCSCSCEH